MEDARIWTMLFSIPRAQRRLQRQQEEQAVPLTRAKAQRKQLYSQLRHFELYATQIASERPVSAVALHPRGQCLLTGDFQGDIRLWSLPDCQMERQFKGTFIVPSSKYTISNEIVIMLIIRSSRSCWWHQLASLAGPA